jgi:hypothetical protein
VIAVKTKQNVRQITLLIAAVVLVSVCCVGAAGLAANVYRTYNAAVQRGESGHAADGLLTADYGFNLNGGAHHQAEYSYLNGDPPVTVPAGVAGDGQITRIGESTVIVYEYHYLGDGAVERTEEPSPYFMFGMTADEIGRTLPEWEIADFTDDKLVLMKIIDSASIQHFTVGIHDGYIAVYYSSGENNGMLKESTNISASRFHESELQRLNDGIRVTGLDMLTRVLQDYGS